MKKTLIIAISGLAIGEASSFGQGFIFLDNYYSNGPFITYGPTGGGTLGAGIDGAFTVGIYFSEGDITGSVAADTTPYGNNIPSNLNPLLVLGTGPNTTAQAQSSAIGIAGRFAADGLMVATAAAARTITFMVVTYNGADYASSTIRGHSAAATILTQGPLQLPPASVGAVMSGFAVNVTIPEPSTAVLTGLGVVSLLLARRRK